MKQSETKKNIINIVNDYSQEFGIAPHFVEKDYYVVKVLSEISKFNYPDLKLVYQRHIIKSKDFLKILILEFIHKNILHEQRKKFFVTIF